MCLPIRTTYKFPFQDKPFLQGQGLFLFSTPNCNISTYSYAIYPDDPDVVHRSSFILLTSAIYPDSTLAL